MNVNINIDELMAEIGRLHVQVMGLNKLLTEAQQKIAELSKPKE